MDFLSRQKKLQAEAKLALAMAKPMAKMQVEVEKQNRKKSPVADLVSSTVTLTSCEAQHIYCWEHKGSVCVRVYLCVSQPPPPLFARHLPAAPI